MGTYQREREVGETFQYKTTMREVTLVVVIALHGCRGCFFNKKHMRTASCPLCRTMAVKTLTGPCQRKNRTDRENVLFRLQKAEKIKKEP